MEDERLAAVLQHTQDLIVVVDDDGTTTYTNPAIQRLLGYTATEREGTNALELLHPDDREAVLERFSTLIDAPERTTERITHRLQHADGHWIWVESIGSDQTDTALGGYVINSREVTERKQYEQRLETQRDNLTVLNEMLRHDIRNDLQIVSAYAELLAERCDGDVEEEAATIIESAAQAVELTRTARDLAEVMLSADRELEPIDLLSVLEREVESVRSTYTDAVVTIEERPGVVSVRADDMLGSVFRNLLKNAVQHNDKPVSEVSVSLALTGERVSVRIADNGPGIPDAQKEEVFGRGEKGLESGGTGIGLYLVARLLDIYGGDVAVRDNDPEGAVFAVELPVAAYDGD